MPLPPVQPNRYPLADPMHVIVTTCHYTQSDLEKYANTFETVRKQIHWPTTKTIQGNNLLTFKSKYLELMIPEFEEFVTSKLETLTVALKSRGEKFANDREFFSALNWCEAIKQALETYQHLNYYIAECTDYKNICPIQHNLTPRFQTLHEVVSALHVKITQMR